MSSSPFGQVSQPLNPPIQHQQQQQPGILAHQLVQQQQQQFMQQQEQMNQMMSTHNMAALHTFPPTLHAVPDGYEASSHDTHLLQQSIRDTQFPVGSLHPDPEPVLQQHQTVMKTEDSQQQPQMMQTVALPSVVPPHNLAGLKPALAWLNQPVTAPAAPVGLELSREQQTLGLQQQPFWLSPQMLDSAHDSMLRPSLA
jgi:hypothetical protein